MEHYAELARDVGSTRPDPIFVFSSALALTFKAAINGESYRVLIRSRRNCAQPAHPGGNITGVAVYGKRLELLQDLVPKLSNAFYLASQPHWERPGPSVAVREAAKRLGISLTPVLLGATIGEASSMERATSRPGWRTCLPPTRSSLWPLAVVCRSRPDTRAKAVDH